MQRVERAFAVCARHPSLLEALDTLEIDAQALARVVERDDTVANPSHRLPTLFETSLGRAFSDRVVVPDVSTRLLLHVAV